MYVVCRIDSCVDCEVAGVTAADLVSPQLRALVPVVLERRRILSVVHVSSSGEPGCSECMREVRVIGVWFLIEVHGVTSSCRRARPFAFPSFKFCDIVELASVDADGLGKPEAFVALPTPKRHLADAVAFRANPLARKVTLLFGHCARS